MANHQNPFIGPLTSLDAEHQRYLELIPRTPSPPPAASAQASNTTMATASDPVMDAMYCRRTPSPPLAGTPMSEHGSQRHSSCEVNDTSDEEDIKAMIHRSSTVFTHQKTTADHNDGESFTQNRLQCVWEALPPMPEADISAFATSLHKVQETARKLSQHDSSFNVQANSRLLSLPKELLDMILEPLLVRRGGSLSLPAFDKKRPPEFRPRLSVSILKTCKKLYAEGQSLLYGENVFNIRPLLVYGMGGFTPVENNSLAKITHIEVDADPLYIYDHIPPPHTHDSLYLKKAVRKYPFGMLQYVQSIQCVLNNDGRTMDLVYRQLKIQQAMDNARNAWHRVGQKEGPEMDKCMELCRQVVDTLFKWNALLIAEAVKQHCPGFARMYRAYRIYEGEDEVEMSIVLCRDTPRLDSMIAFSKRQGLIFKAELEVDLEQRIVKEIAGDRAGHCW